MSTANPSTAPHGHGHDPDRREDLGEIHHDWTLFSGIGALTIVLGLVMFLSTFARADLTILVTAWLLVATGAAQVAGAFLARRWIGSVAATINGLLYLGIAIVLFSERTGDVGGLMLAVAGLVFTSGVARVGLAMLKRYTHREISLFNGVLALLISGMIGAAWYGGLSWGVGLLLGIEVMMTGVAWVAFSVALKRVRGGAAA